MKSICIIIFLFYVNVQPRYLPDDSNAAESEHIAEETQHAICQISSADLEATANATITRQLKNVCTSSYLDARINSLEQTLITEINNIKMLLNSRQALKDPIRIVKKHNLKSPANKKSKSVSKRETEISNQNMTIEKDNSGIKFTYFWRINNILEVLALQDEIESGDFYFSGNHLYVKMYPNYLQSKTIFIQAVGIEEFHLSHKFIFLDQTTDAYDIISPLLNCNQIQCTGFQLSHDILYAKNFMLNNDLFVKLVIFLAIN